MKRPVCVLTILVCLSTLLAAQSKPRLAVLPFTGGTGNEGDTAASLFSNQSELDDAFIVVPRTKAVESIVREQKYQRTGLTDTDTIAALGKQMNADFVVAGHITALGRNKLVLISIINVESFQQVGGDYRVYSDLSEIRPQFPAMAKKMIERAGWRFVANQPALAVLPFNIAINGVSATEAEVLAQLLSIEVANMGKYRVLPRTSSIERVMSEQKYQRLGITDSESIKAIGKALNAQFVLSGNVGSLGSANYFDVKILDVETGGRVRGGDAEYKTVADGVQLMSELSMRLTVSAESDFTYEIAGTGANRSVVIKKYTGKSPVVIIPRLIRDIRVKKIDSGAIHEKIVSVFIPDTIGNIDWYAFSYTQMLEEITVSESNAACKIVDGVLFTNGGTILMRYPPKKSGKKYAIPQGVTMIAPSAFRECHALTAIDIPRTVTNISYNAFSNCSSLHSVNIPTDVTVIYQSAFYGCSSLTSITIPAGVTEIGWSAFSDCSSLTSITIPASVTTIGLGAFFNCSSLRSIEVVSGNTAYRSIDGVLFSKDGTTLVQYPAQKEQTKYSIPKGVTTIGYGAFSGCSSLTKIDIPRTLTNIGGSVFFNCTNLTSLTIAAGVAKIGDEAFRGCSSLTSITIPARVTEIGYGAFGGCSSLTSITIPARVTEIGYGAFENCSSLTSISIPAGVTWIGGKAFSGCSSLTSMTIPARVTEIDSETFENCSSLASISIPAGVTEIGWSAFRGCSSLIEITIPASVTEIDSWTFENCSSLIAISIPAGVTEIGDRAFDGCSSLRSIEVVSGNTAYRSIDGVLFSKDGTTLSLYPPGKRGTYIIPKGVTNIGDEAFRDCSSLTSITIPAGVTTIGDGVFWGCSSLTSITIPAGVTTIDGSAFRDCSSLTSISIPAGVTEIGSWAFYGCSSLTSITIPASVTTIDYGAFSDCSSLTSITIPASVTTIGWSAFYGCSSLVSVTIPAGVTKIGDKAFVGCKNLNAKSRADIERRFGSGVFEED